jgi:hypothetical protein
MRLLIPAFAGFSNFPHCVRCIFAQTQFWAARLGRAGVNVDCRYIEFSSTVSSLNGTRRVAHHFSYPTDAEHLGLPDSRSLRLSARCLEICLIFFFGLNQTGWIPSKRSTTNENALTQRALSSEAENRL